MSFQSYEHDVTYNGSTMNASSGCSSILTYYLNQAHNAGITLVGAAGNYNTTEPSYPGSNNYVINVGSLSSDGTAKAPFSNYGSNIDIVAPGYVHVADKGTNSSYKDTAGTSFSAPLVTGAIALYKQKHPSATPAQIEQALYDSCDTIPNSSSWAGHGALNVANFLDIAGETNTPVTGVTLNAHSLTLSLDDDATLVATITPSNATNKALTFTSSDEDVVMVDEQTGYLLPVDVGTATITVTTADGGFTDTCTVTITNSGAVTPTLTSISLSGVTNTIPYKSTYSTSGVVVTAHYSDSSSQVVTNSASITSSIDTGVLGNQALTYSYTEGGITQTVSSTVKVTNNGASSNVGDSSESSLTPQTPVTWTFTSSAGAYSGGASGTSWTVGGTVQGYEESRGIQWSKNAGSLTLSGFSSSYVITSIVVTCSANATGSTMSVTVGGDTFDTAQSIGNSNGQTKTFTNADGMSGAVVISTTKGSKSVYIKSVQISYSIEEQSGTSYPATPTDQAKAWSTYFLNNIKPSCNISGENSNITAITSIWSELKSEFNYMVSASKTAFASSNDTTISEARQLYTLLVNKYQGLEKYINGINNSAKTPLFVEINDKNIDLLIMLIGLIGLISLGGYVFHTKRR